ncbi:hypothetical protein [Streptomyces sp. NPDC093109]|uniref:hypothetical protein n=1 Tax=Streptomyces sp. NPDC093109 TaxID=3154977 RepID=UPI00344F0493
MRTRTARTTLTALAVTALLTLTACEDTGTPGTGGGTETSTGTGTGTTDSRPTGATTAVLPDLVGRQLGSARSTVRKAGFPELTSHDALGRGRGQFLDRNWKVCAQTPAPGTLPLGTRIDVGTVKTGEECPAKDPGEPTSDGTMPDFTGKSVRFARAAFDKSADLTARDVSGENRAILVESHWKVCGQDPAPGVRLTGRPIRLDTVKFDEKCP